jgi:hypothetical protein
MRNTMKKRKLTKELRRETGMQTRKLEKFVRLSHGTIIRERERTEEEVLEIASILSGMCLEDSVITDLMRISNPSEGQIAQRVAFYLQRHADMLAAFGDALTELSRVKSDAVLALKVECPAV